MIRIQRYYQFYCTATRFFAGLVAIVVRFITGIELFEPYMNYNRQAGLDMPMSMYPPTDGMMNEANRPEQLDFRPQLIRLPIYYRKLIL